MQDNPSCPNCEGSMILHDIPSAKAKCRNCGYIFSAEEYTLYFAVTEAETDAFIEAEMVEKDPQADMEILDESDSIPEADDAD